MRHITVILTCLFLLVGAGFVYVMLNMQDFAPFISRWMMPRNEAGEHVINPHGFPKPVAPAPIIARDPQWLHYRDDILGIEFDYPDKVVAGGRDCAAYFADLITLTSRALSFVVLTPQLTHEDCGDRTPTLENFEQNTGDLTWWIGWKINVFSAQNEADLERYIQQHYGSGCLVRKHTESSQAGTYDMEILEDGLSPEISTCWVNYMVAIKYSPEHKKFAVWDMGQDWSFIASTDPGIGGLDGHIVESFRFLE